jgi:hypothetical protein
MTPPPSCVGPSCTDGACSARTCEVAPPPPPEPAPRPLPGCASRRCPEDFDRSGIAGRFPDGTAACEAATTCVRDVFPGCTNYRGASDSPWGIWCVVRGGCRGGGTPVQRGGPKRPTVSRCADTLQNFDANLTMPQNIGDEQHPIFYFEPASSAKAKVNVTIDASTILHFLPPS